MRCHQVDTRRAMPSEESPALSCTVSPKTGCQSICKAGDRYHSLFTTSGTDQRETGIITVWHRPLCVYPDVIAHDQMPISQAFPHHACILQVIKYWQWERPGNEASTDGLIIASCLQLVGFSEKVSAQ